MKLYRRLLTIAASTVLAVAGSASALTSAAAAGTYQEQYRPQFHFSPAQNWMNDPNGPIYYKGRYHLFFQYNPSGNTWGNMSWGHAVSPDLVHWKQLPLAIPQDDKEMIFSGSVVYDRTNSSGLGTSDNPPLVAIYTSQQKASGLQQQALASSTDGGTTWRKYSGNPVLDIGSPNFRDPKVFWYEPTKSWLMVLALSDQRKVSFYSSKNLKDWTHLSDFGPAGATIGVWECPDLFPLAVDGNPADVKWVLVVNSLAGDLGAEYFVGRFDGTRFTSDEPVSYTPPTGNVLADFEQPTYGDWTTTGTAFGAGPVAGTLPNQQTVSGYAGDRLVNSFRNGDSTTGTLTSPSFTIAKPYLNFLVGGGDHPHVPGSSTAGAAPDGTTFAGFDGTDWGQGWTATGNLAGASPAEGSLPGQQNVSGYLGDRLVNTFVDGDAGTGTLTSPSFTIDSDHIDFLIGGGRHPIDQPNPTAVNLLVDGVRVASATGNNSEAVNWSSWDVSAYRGRQATIQVVDDNSTTGVGSWGHLLLDEIRFSDQAASTLNDFEADAAGWGDGWTGTGDFAATGPTTENLPGQQGARVLDTCVNSCDGARGTITSSPFTVTADYLDFLIAGGHHPMSGDHPTAINLLVDGQIVRTATGTDSGDMNWVAWNLAQYRGRQVQVQVVDDNDGSTGWGHIMVDDLVQSDHAAQPLANDTTVNLLVDGATVRSSTGHNSEHLDWASWDLRDLQGKQARIQIVDAGTGGWGHILADQFTLADAPALDEVHRAHWIDYGADYYATTTYNDAPDGQRIMMAWMNNWNYGQSIPTSPWRSADAFPRTLSLVTVDGAVRLEQVPVASINSLHDGPPTVVTRRTVSSSTDVLPVSGGTLDLRATLSAGTASRFGLDVHVGNGQYTRIGYDTTTHRLYIDRSHSGDVSFSPAFTPVQSAPLALENGVVHLRVLVDASSVEVYADGGLVTLTDQIFPDPSSTGVQLFATSGTADLRNLQCWNLVSAW
jgi:sucrose-6-phosphate hydrolase SacC (GH32 family)